MSSKIIQESVGAVVEGGSKPEKTLSQKLVEALRCKSISWKPVLRSGSIAVAVDGQDKMSLTSPPM